LFGMQIMAGMGEVDPLSMGLDAFSNEQRGM
jgi:hypothetical protein